MVSSTRIIKNISKISLAALFISCLTFSSLQASGDLSLVDDISEASPKVKRKRGSNDTLDQFLSDFEMEGVTRDLLSLSLQYTKYQKTGELPDTDPTYDPTRIENFQHLKGYWMSDNPDEKEFARRALHDIALNHGHALEAALILRASPDRTDQEIAAQSLQYILNHSDHPQHHILLNPMSHDEHPGTSKRLGSPLPCTASSAEFCTHPERHPDYCTEAFAPPPTLSLTQRDYGISLSSDVEEDLSQSILIEPSLSNTESIESIDLKIQHLKRKYRLEEDRKKQSKIKLKLKKLQADAKRLATPSTATSSTPHQPQIEIQKEEKKLTLKGILKAPKRRTKNHDNADDLQAPTKSPTKTVRFSDTHQYKTIPSRYDALEASKPIRPTLIREETEPHKPEASTLLSYMKALAQGTVALFDLFK